jgi:hypothetical protein
MSRRPFPLAICLLAAVLLVAPASASTVIYSDLGPGGSYDSTQGYSLFHYGFLLVQFVASANGPAVQADLALEGNLVTAVSLWTDSGGGPGTQLCSAQANSALSGLTTMTLAGCPALIAGQSYFIQDVLTAGLGEWNYNNQGITGSVASVGDNATLPAFDVLGPDPATPEPSTLLLLLPGAALLVLRRYARSSYELITFR